VDEIAFLCKHYAAEYIALCKPNLVSTGSRTATWKRPNQGWVKVNSDGVFSENTGEGGWGVVIRDEEGEVVEAAAGKLTRLMDAFQSEVEACLAGVMLVGERGFGRIVVETDSLVLKQALKTSSHRLAATGGLICEIQNLLASEFSGFQVDYAPRSCNKVAHALAAIGCKCSHGAGLRWESTPTLVEDLVANDRAASLS